MSQPGGEKEDLSPEYVKALGEALINSRSEPDVEDTSTPPSMPDLVSSSEEADYNGMADESSGSDDSGPVHDAMDCDSTAPTVNDIHERMADFRLQGPHGQDLQGAPQPDYQIFSTYLNWRQQRAWDHMTMTPGRQSREVQSFWRERDRREALIWLGSLARISEAEVSSNTDVDTELALAARRLLNRDHRADRSPESFQAFEFSWTFRCTDGCGWAEDSEVDIEQCPRCYPLYRQPKKYPTFLDKVGAEAYNSRPSDSFATCASSAHGIANVAASTPLAWMFAF